MGNINSGENISCTGSLNITGGTVINGDGILLKTNGEIHLEAGIDLPIYLNNDVVCNKSIYLNGSSSIIASSGTIQGKYFKAFNSSSLHTDSLENSSYLGYNSLGLGETNLISVSTAIESEGFYFHNKTISSTD